MGEALGMGDGAGFHGAGLGLRRALLGPLSDMPPGGVDFMEVAPENWIGIGGRLGRRFADLAQRYTISLHGLSLNIGGQAPIDRELVSAIGAFMRQHSCPIYSEHLTYCGDDGHLYDLLPIPFTAEAVSHVAGRVRQVQDMLGTRIALENASYYTTPGADPGAASGGGVDERDRPDIISGATPGAASGGEMSECDFIRAVLEEADCDLLLDVNNVYVNSVNHRYDPVAFMRGLPLERARYIHVAGHFDEAADLKVDTHGADVIDPVWQLLEEAYRLCGPLPTLLERDFNIPPLATLLGEVEMIRRLQARQAGQRHYA